MISRDKERINSALCERGPYFENRAWRCEEYLPSKSMQGKLCRVRSFLYREEELPVVGHISTNMLCASTMFCKSERRYVLPLPACTCRKKPFHQFRNRSSLFMSMKVCKSLS